MKISSIYINFIISENNFYSISKHLGRCSRKYSKSSCDAPGQFVNSSSCKWRNWIKLDKPLDVKSGHPIQKKTLICKNNLKKNY